MLFVNTVVKPQYVKYHLRITSCLANTISEPIGCLSHTISEPLAVWQIPSQNHWLFVKYHLRIIGCMANTISKPLSGWQIPSQKNLLFGKYRLSLSSYPDSDLILFCLSLQNCPPLFHGGFLTCDICLFFC